MRIIHLADSVSPLITAWDIYDPVVIFYFIYAAVLKNNFCHTVVLGYLQGESTRKENFGRLWSDYIYK